MKKLFTALSTLIIISFLSLVSAQTIIPGGPVSGTWNQAGSPYLIQGDISIDETSSLLIEPGVNVLFQGYYRLLCEGQLIASGTETDSIIFTSEDTSEGWDGIDFVDLDMNVMDSSRLEYCELSYGVASRLIGGLDTDKGGALYLMRSSKLLINNCLIANNRTSDRIGQNGANGIYPGGDGQPGESVESSAGGAIYCDNSHPIIRGCSIIGNRTGRAKGGEGGNGAYEETSSYAQGGDGALGGNAISGNGGAIVLMSSNAQFSDCIFRNNTTGDAEGGDGGRGGTAICWNGNAYGGNGDAGGDVTTGNGGTIFIYNSTPIMNNILVIFNSTGASLGGWGGWGGGAIALSGMIPYSSSGGDGGDGGNIIRGQGSAIYYDAPNLLNINNMTLSGNYCGEHEQGQGGNGGGADYPGENGEPGLILGDPNLVSGSNLHFVNSIFAQNPVYNLSMGVTADYSCLEYMIPGVGNFTADPIFASNPFGDFYLSHTASSQSVQSPCVDAGCPDSTMINGTTRTDGIADSGIVDMGFHYPTFDSYPDISFNVSELNFEAMVGSSNPPMQYFVIDNSWNTHTFNYSIEGSVDWLQISPVAGGPVPPADTVSVWVDINGLSGGLYEGEVVVTSQEAQNSPRILPVYLYINYLDGNISGVMSSENYFVNNGITLPAGDSLIVEPGVNIYFNNDAYFNLFGYCSFVGSEIDSIILMEMVNADTGWGGLTVDYESLDTVYFKYCRVSGAAADGMTLIDGHFVVEHCNISGNTGGLNCYGIRLHDGFFVVKHCNISYNAGGIRCSGCSALLRNCLIMGNSPGGGCYISSVQSRNYLYCNDGGLLLGF